MRVLEAIRYRFLSELRGRRITALRRTWRWFLTVKIDRNHQLKNRRIEESRGSIGGDHKNVGGASSFSRSSALRSMQMQFQHLPATGTKLRFTFNVIHFVQMIQNFKLSYCTDDRFRFCFDFLAEIKNCFAFFLNICLQHHCRCCGRTLCHEHSSFQMV